MTTKRNNHSNLANDFDMTTTLSDYPRLPISQYTDGFRRSQKPVTALEVNYQFRGKQYSYDLPLTTTRPNFGGKRYWWKCPRCYRRVSVLYCAGYFVCRHCIGAKYQTQHLQPLDRQFKRIATLRSRLGWSGGVAHGIGEKPKGMHQRTYDRLLNEYHVTANRVLVMTLDQLPKGISDDL